MECLETIQKQFTSTVENFILFATADQTAVKFGSLFWCRNRVHSPLLFCMITDKANSISVSTDYDWE